MFTRREFLKASCATAAGMYFVNPTPIVSKLEGYKNPHKVVIVGFGGGVRFQDSFGDPSHQLIPNIWNRIRPWGTYFSNVMSKGAVDHSVGYKNILSGNWCDSQKDVIKWPSFFERYRKLTGESLRSTWCCVWGSDVANHYVGTSLHPDYGPGYSALTLHPKSLQAWWQKMRSQGSSGFVEPDIPVVGYSRRAFAYAPADKEVQEHLYDFVKQNEFLQDTGIPPGGDATIWEERANQLYIRLILEQYRPKILFLSFCGMDIAHTASFEEYQQGIANADLAMSAVWELIQSNPFYRDDTLLIITPDIGRDWSNQENITGSFQQHTGNTEETNHRNGMIVFGPGILQGAVIDKEVQQIDIVPTIAKSIGLPDLDCEGKVMEEVFAKEG